MVYPITNYFLFSVGIKANKRLKKRRYCFGSAWA